MVDGADIVEGMPSPKKDLEAELRDLERRAASSGMRLKKDGTGLEKIPVIGRPAKPVRDKNWQPLCDAVGGVTELARRLGVAYSTVNRWTMNERSPGPEHLEKLTRLVKLLKVQHPVEWLR